MIIALGDHLIATPSPGCIEEYQSFISLPYKILCHQSLALGPCQRFLLKNRRDSGKNSKGLLQLSHAEFRDGAHSEPQHLHFPKHPRGQWA